MWDEYIRGETNRISPEAPVPVVRVASEERRPGGATNVLLNLKELGVPAGIIAITGNDDNGRQMKETLESWELHDVVIPALERPTSIKTRIIAQNQQLLRIDRENAEAIDSKTEDTILETFRSIVGKYQAVILSDYDKGLLTPRIISEIIRLSREKKIPVAVDPQVRHFQLYRGATVMTPNEKEASEGIGAAFPKNDAESETIGKKIIENLELDHLLLTRSHKGMALFEKDRETVFIPTIAREVYDVTGAGDTVIAVYTAALASGASTAEATQLANTAAGVVVGKFGTATATTDEILEH